MKTLLTLFVLLFSSLVVAEEQYLECTEMKAKMDCNSETCNLLGYEKTENIYYLKFFDVPLYIAYFSPKDMESEKVKDFYKNNSSPKI